MDSGRGKTQPTLGSAVHVESKQLNPLNTQASALRHEQIRQALALDIAQLVLDITGIVDPTPISDGTNVLIHLGRGNFWDAAISGVSLIPWLGDAAKLGRFPSYTRTMKKAIAFAEFDLKFATYLRPVLEKLNKHLKTLLSGIGDQLPEVAQKHLKILKKDIEAFVTKSEYNPDVKASHVTKKKPKPSAPSQGGKASSKSGSKAPDSKPPKKKKNSPPKPSVDDLAENILKKAQADEKAVTEALSGISDQIGGKMTGLEYRLKSKDSLMRKIATDAKQQGIPVEEAAQNINDALRYTTLLDGADFGPKVIKAFEALETAGFKKQVVKNTFKEGAVYKGVNTTFISPKGQKFELQFHTPESFHVKQNVNHSLYEEVRLDSTPVKQQKALIKKMRQNSAEIPPVEGVDLIENLK